MCANKETYVRDDGDDDRNFGKGGLQDGTCIKIVIED